MTFGYRIQSVEVLLTIGILLAIRLRTRRWETALSQYLDHSDCPLILIQISVQEVGYSTTVTKTKNKLDDDEKEAEILFSTPKPTPSQLRQ